MKFKYVTIEREYGSGGTTIARRLAEACGISCYGEEILEAVSKKLDISMDQIQKYEETVSNSFLYTNYMIGRVQAGEADMLSREGHLFIAEQQEIQHLAASGPAIFIGHCAAEALKDRPVLKVFIRCSDEAQKKQRITAEYGVSPSAVAGTCKRFDAKRSRYFFANTAQKWGDLHNYDLVLDSAGLGIDGCVSALQGCLRVKTASGK